MSRKITLIGAGSVVFAKTLIGDILQFPELSDSTICLMDIDPARLKVADTLMRRICTKLGVSAKVESTLSQRDAIRGAKYVICTIQVGGYKPCTVTDFEIPKKYGLRQTIADTLGVGGVFRALRTIPVINQIARDIADVGHRDCLLLNYTNPMAMNCWAVDRGVGIPHVGLCHSVFGTARMLSKYAKIPYEDVSYLVAGVNHMAFFLQFKYKGQDAYPLLFKALNDPERHTERVRFEMMRRLGYFVTESSEHQSEYVPHFIPHGDSLIEQFDIPLDEYIRRCEAIISTWQSQERKLLGDDANGDIDVRPQSHEYGSYIIHSIETNTLRTVYGNVPNRHIIDNLTQGCNVEVPCQVDGTGLNPLRIGALPPQLAAICMSQINVQALTVEAALTAKREHIYHAVMADPNTAATLTLDKIWAMCDELIEAHQKDGFLGDFSSTLPNTGRGYTGIGDTVIATLATTSEFRMASGDKNVLELVVENPSKAAIDIQFTLRSSNPDIVIAENTRIRMTVPAGQTGKHAVTLINQADIQDEVEITLAADHEDVLALNAQLMPRTIYQADDAGTIPIQMQLHGFDAVSGALTLHEDTLTLSLEIVDSNIQTHLENPGVGSVVEFFVAQNGDIPTTHITIVPDKATGQLMIKKGRSERIEPIDSHLTITNMNYTLTASLPLTALNLKPGSSFLFELAATLSALGDAHSGGRTSLNRSHNPHDSSHYAVFRV